MKYIILVLCLFAACSKAYVVQNTLEGRAAENLKKIALLKTGTRVKKIEKLLGPPDKVDHVFVNGTGMVDFYFYRTGVTNKSVEDDFTPLVFKDGQLLVMGWPFYRMMKVAQNPHNSVISKLTINHTQE